MTGPVTVRAADLTDIAALARFQTDTWREAYAGLVPAAYLDTVGAADRESRWRARYESGIRIGLAVTGAGEVVGAASSCPRRDEDPGPDLELTTLYVAREYRGTGTADRLADFAVDNRPAYLWVFRANPRAIAFYRRIGFAEDGRSKIDPDTGVAELRMTRSAPAER